MSKGSPIVPVRIPAHLLRQMDEWIARGTGPHSRSSLIIEALWAFLRWSANPGEENHVTQAETLSRGGQVRPGGQVKAFCEMARPPHG